MARTNGNLRCVVAASQSADQNRTYLMVQATSGTVTIQLDSGSVITLTTAGPYQVWEPRVPPTNAFTITGTGVMVLG